MRTRCPEKLILSINKDAFALFLLTNKRRIDCQFRRRNPFFDVLDHVITVALPGSHGRRSILDVHSGLGISGPGESGRITTRDMKSKRRQHIDKPSKPLRELPMPPTRPEPPGPSVDDPP